MKKERLGSFFPAILLIVCLCPRTIPAETGWFPQMETLEPSQDVFPIVDSSVFVLAAPLVRAFQRKDFHGQLLDVRSPALKREIVLPGSLSLLPHHVKTYQNLRSVPLYLIDQGTNPHVLEALCLELREHGFQAYAVWGGLLAWQRAGGSLTGDLASPRRIDPATLLAAGERLRWIAIGPPGSIPQGWKDRTDGPIPAAGLVTQLRQWEQEQQVKGTPGKIRVIIGERGSDRTVQATLMASRLAPVFLLEGGWQALQKWQTAQFLQHRATQLRLQRQKVGECQR